MKRQLTAAFTLLVALSAAPAFASRAAADAHYKKGIAAKRAGDVDGAIASFEAALKEDATYSSAMFSLGVMYKKKGDLEKAKKHLTDATKAAPDHGPSHLSLGQLILREGLFADSRVEFDAALKGKEMQTDDKAEAYNGIGVSYRYEGKTKDAVAAFDEALKLAPSNWTIYVNKAITLNKSGDKTLLADAEAAYRKAAELAPKEPDPWMGVGITCRKQGKFDDAIVAYEKGLALNPKDGDAWYDLASMYLKKEQHDKSLAAFEAYLKLAKPGSQTAEEAEAYVEQLRKKLKK